MNDTLLVLSSDTLVIAWSPPYALRAQDTLTVALSNIKELSSSTPFYETASFWVAGLSLIVAIISIILQYRIGEVVVSKVSAVGFWVPFNGVDPRRGVASGEPSQVICIVPLMCFNTGSTHKEVVDSQITLRTKSRHIKLNSNRFMMDVGREGKHELPSAISWIHQIIVKPKDSELKYVEFVSGMLSKSEKLMLKSILLQSTGVEGLFFEIRIQGKDGRAYVKKSSFSIFSKDVANNDFGNSYSIYKAN